MGRFGSRKVSYYAQPGLAVPRLLPDGLMAAAATTATGAASARKGRGRGGLGGAAIAGAVAGGKNRKLDARLLAGAPGAGDFLLLVDHDLLKSGFAVAANVFVDGHSGYFLRYTLDSLFSRRL